MSLEAVRCLSLVGASRPILILSKIPRWNPGFFLVEDELLCYKLARSQSSLRQPSRAEARAIIILAGALFSSPAFPATTRPRRPPSRRRQMHTNEELLKLPVPYA